MNQKLHIHIHKLHGPEFHFNSSILRTFCDHFCEHFFCTSNPKSVLELQFCTYNTPPGFSQPVKVALN